MSADFIVLLVAAAASAWGTWASFRKRGFGIFPLVAVVLYTLVGAHTVLLAMLTGDGRVLPGFQMNPAVKQRWGDLLATASPEPGYCLFALLAHLLLLLPRPTRTTLLRPLPATLVYVVFFLLLQERTTMPATNYERATGPGRVAWLTLVPLKGDRVRMVFAEGEDDHTLLRVRHIHTCEGAPTRPRLMWTKDGNGVIFASRYKRIFAFDTDGNTVGALPIRLHDWPPANPGAQPVASRRRFSQAARDVAEFLLNHGGPHLP